jgi:hypothetical protein
LLLKRPTLDAAVADPLSVASRFAGPTGALVLNNVKHDASAIFKSIDLTGVAVLVPVVYLIDGQAGGEVEVYLDGPSGKKIGTTSFAKITAVDVMKGVKIKSSRLKLDKINGTHDLLIVFKNDQAGNKDLFFFGRVELGRE